MFGYSMADIGNIVVMQGFSGLSMFTVLLLMALGLAIIFGQMGVINMAHGEFMAIGAYTTVMISKLAAAYGFVNYYFLFAIVIAFGSGVYSRLFY
jgi:urea transport system permease protein